MKIVKYARYVGTMIGPEGPFHRWTALRKNFAQRANKINESTKSLVERLCEFKIYALSVLGYPGSISAPDEATLKEETHAIQSTTADPYNAFLLTYIELVPCTALALIYLVSTLSALLPGKELPPPRAHSPTAWRKSKQLVDMIVPLFMPPPPSGCPPTI